MPKGPMLNFSQGDKIHWLLGPCSTEKINKINKPLSRLIKKRRARTEINKIGNERREVTTDTTEKQRIVRPWLVWLCGLSAGL